MAPAPDGASALALGIDLGGTKIAAGVVDASGRILGRGHRLTQPQEGWEAVVDRMVAAGVEAANLFFRNVPLAEAVAARFDRPTYLDHDARVAALGEYRFGAGQGATHLVFVTVSTGIGAGIIVKGRPHQGAHFAAGELGH